METETTLIHTASENTALVESERSQIAQPELVARIRTLLVAPHWIAERPESNTAFAPAHWVVSSSCMTTGD